MSSDDHPLRDVFAVPHAYFPPNQHHPQICPVSVVFGESESLVLTAALKHPLRLVKLDLLPPRSRLSATRSSSGSRATTTLPCALSHTLSCSSSLESLSAL